jgi:hypothetical protein
MTDRSIAVQTCVAIQVQFEFEMKHLPSALDDATMLEKLREYLAERILDLMNSNFEQLMQTLYKVDLDESRVKEIFRNTDELLIADRLAELVIERQRMKAVTRAAYRNSHNQAEME